MESIYINKNLQIIDNTEVFVFLKIKKFKKLRKYEKREYDRIYDIIRINIDSKKSIYVLTPILFPSTCSSRK